MKSEINNHPQKNTLLKNAQANAESIFFKRVFFSATQENFLPTLLKKEIYFSQPTSLLQTLTDIASNVNRFYKQLCKLGQTQLRTNSKPAHNIRLKEILKKGALTVKRTVVHLSNSCGYTNSRASNPPF